MRRITTAILTILWISVAHAEQPKNLEATMKDIARDLAAMQEAADLVSQKSATYGQVTIKSIRLTGKSVAIHKGAAEYSDVVTKLPEGKVLPVIDKAGEWYAVSLDQPNIAYKSGWVHASSVVPETYTLPDAVRSITESINQLIIDMVRGLKEKYDNNPYVHVKGFSVNVSIPPAVSISFEFK